MNQPTPHARAPSVGCSTPEPQTALAAPESSNQPMSWRPGRWYGAGAMATAMLLSACVVAPVAPRHPRPIYSGQGPSGGPPGGLPVSATPLYFYPEKGQSEDQQDRDRYECYRWAVRESGVDPGMTTVRQPLPPPPPVSGEALRDGSGVVAGAATGAILGAAVSSPRQAGVNAVIGAIFGAALGGSAQESRAQAIEQSQARQQQAAGVAAQAARVPLDNFRRAMSACMQGRGYRVS